MFEVRAIIDGNTIEVSPNWKWNEKSGGFVRIAGYAAVDAHNKSFAVNKLTTLLLNKSIELKNATSIIGNDTIICSVYLNGVDVAQYFPEFKDGI